MFQRLMIMSQKTAPQNADGVMAQHYKLQLQASALGLKG